jgi:O-acetyl-ADP-ribose deacetylase (regulator of RNase III)
MKFIKGNLLDAPSQAYVNTVNTVGVMGKGIALQFKEAFPLNYKVYVAACKRKEVQPGKLLVVRENTLHGEKIIINFPTKTVWYSKSKYEYIEEGLQDLVRVIKEYSIRSIAIPPLGCGNGGLKWEKVRKLLEERLQSVQGVDIYIYEPNEIIKKILKQQESKNESSLTDARALLLYALFYYESIGEKSSLFVANKLAYFFQRLGEKSMAKLKFDRGQYGPFSMQVAHMLHGMNGKYLKGLEQMNAKAFEPLELQYEQAKEVSEYVRKKLTQEQRTKLKNLIALIDGFQSALSLEILASVDFVRKENPAVNQKETVQIIQNWSERKKGLFKESYISIAFNHLQEYSAKLYFN